MNRYNYSQKGLGLHFYVASPLRHIVKDNIGYDMYVHNNDIDRWVQQRVGHTYRLWRNLYGSKTFSSNILDMNKVEIWIRIQISDISTHSQKLFISYYSWTFSTL